MHGFMAQETVGLGVGWMQVGVTVPSAVPLWNSLRSVQRVNIINTLASSQRAIRVLYPPGNDTVLDVSITAGAGGNASMLLHPLLGLNVSVNGVGLPLLVPVPGGQAAVDQLRSLLQTALKLTALDVGVELVLTQGAGVTFRVAVPQAKVCSAACLVLFEIIDHCGRQFGKCLLAAKTLDSAHAGLHMHFWLGCAVLIDSRSHCCTVFVPCRLAA